jgi:inorganic pyrophosphatase
MTNYAEVETGKIEKGIVNVIIEIRKNERNKYEFDKSTGRLFLDRVNGTTLGYPADYGYIPGTLCEDGDPLDALLIIDESVPHGTVVPARPIGVLYFEDDGEMDEKLITVPADDVSKDHIKDLADLGDNFKSVVEHFYSHYKDWKNGWTGVEGKLSGWGDASAAMVVVNESIERAKK